MKYRLRFTGKQYATLRARLFPGDGKEAVALVLCGRRAGEDDHIFVARQLHPVPHEQCAVRTSTQVTWPTTSVPALLQEAMRRRLGVVKVHSHPNGLRTFSDQDDDSDRSFFASVDAWLDDGLPHGSAVMLPEGTMFGRVVEAGTQFRSLDLVSVAGDDLSFWASGVEPESDGEALVRHRQLFGEGTVSRLRRLTVAVIGCSGTGSIVIEQLARLGVGRLILVDPESVERKNLNRIVNATMKHAEESALKVHVLADAIRAMGLGTEVVPIAKNLADPAVIKLVATADVAFGCMDGAEGRHLLNRLATFYSLPYFDVGVLLEADGQGGIDQVAGTVHYLQPDGSSLLSRRVYAMADVEAEGLKRTDPVEYGERVKANYIRGVRVERPAVISVNMLFASIAVNEFLSRLHPYRYDLNRDFAVHRISLVQAATYFEGDGPPCKVLAKHVGRGDVRPLLDMPSLSERLQ
ncbi:thiamine biosynthesis protein ThiF [Planctomycetaceae bacterium SCGC AG-212-D15]|nr:thiamine biosynthesis protein ThiF [Planctomycetaceae bacterium SCGC AG-212-D15]